MSNKIFNIGFNKSGTISLTKAMEILGFKTIHYRYKDEIISDIVRKNKSNNKKLLEGLDNFEFFSDFSGEGFYKELDEQYPFSKFILTIREMGSWLKSREEHVKRYGKNKEIDKLKWKKQRENKLFELEKYFKNRQKDFLIIDIVGGEGWGKLCGFLSKPIPSESFPFLNKT